MDGQPPNKKLYKMPPEPLTLPIQYMGHHSFHASQAYNGQLCLRNEMPSESVHARPSSYEIGYRNFIQNDEDNIETSNLNHQKFHQRISDSLYDPASQNVYQIDSQSDKEGRELHEQSHWSTPQSRDLAQGKLFQGVSDDHYTSGRLNVSSSSSPHSLCQSGRAYQNVHSYDLVHSYGPNFTAPSPLEAAVDFTISGLQPNEAIFRMSTENRHPNEETHTVADDVETYTEIDPFVDNGESYTVRDSPTAADCLINADTGSPLPLSPDSSDIATAGASQTVRAATCDSSEQFKHIPEALGDISLHHSGTASYEQQHTVTAPSQDPPADVAQSSGYGTQEQQLNERKLENRQVEFPQIHEERQSDEAIPSQVLPSLVAYDQDALSEEFGGSLPSMSNSLDPGLSAFLILNSGDSSPVKEKSDPTSHKVVDYSEESLNASPKLPLPALSPKALQIPFTQFNGDNASTTIDSSAPDLSLSQPEQEPSFFTLTSTAADPSPGLLPWSNEPFLSDLPEQVGFEFNAQLFNFLPDQAWSTLAPPSDSIDWGNLSGFTP
jgi:hypothetical protein